MPLTSGSREHTVHEEGVNFTMLAPDGVAVPCHVERSALDVLVGGAGQLAATQQVAVFLVRRPDIERVASQKYDSGVQETGVVVIRNRDLRDLGILK